RQCLTLAGFERQLMDDVIPGIAVITVRAGYLRDKFSFLQTQGDTGPTAPPAMLDGYWILARHRSIGAIEVIEPRATPDHQAGQDERITYRLIRDIRKTTSAGASPGGRKAELEIELGRAIGEAWQGEGWVALRRVRVNLIDPTLQRGEIGLNLVCFCPRLVG